jgi:hypothetical protein
MNCARLSNEQGGYDPPTSIQPFFFLIRPILLNLDWIISLKVREITEISKGIALELNHGFRFRWGDRSTRNIQDHLEDCRGARSPYRNLKRIFPSESQRANLEFELAYIYPEFHRCCRISQDGQ